MQDKLDLKPKQFSKLINSEKVQNFIASQKYKTETIKGKGNPKKLVKC
jgi:hypothetical protein